MKHLLMTIPAVLLLAVVTLGAAEPKAVMLRGQVVDLNAELKRTHKVDIAAKWTLQRCVTSLIHTFILTTAGVTGR